jgi:hypothetical protein
MRRHEFVDRSVVDVVEFEMWHRLHEVRCDRRRQLVAYATAIAAAGILSFLFLIRMSA